MINNVRNLGDLLVEFLSLLLDGQTLIVLVRVFALLRLLVL